MTGHTGVHSVRASRGEHGAILALGALLLTVTLLFVALVIGVSWLSSSHARTQNMANLAAIAALEETMTGGSYTDAVNRVDALLRQNELLGGAMLSGITPGGGDLQWGRWLWSPAEGSCPIDYPCFVPNPNPTNPRDATAVRAEVRTPQGSPLIVPFARLLGQDRFDLVKDATATWSGQCTVVVQDATLSTTFDTHRPSGSSQSLFAFPERNYSCSAASTSASGSIYCGLAATRPSGATDRTIHFQNEYRQVRAGGGAGFLLVDALKDTPSGIEGPEPLRSLFLASHAAFKASFPRSSGTLWRGIGLADDLYPIPANRFLEDPGVIIQATNLDNRGTFDRAGALVDPTISPNLFSFGWYPRAHPGSTPTLDRSTNIIRALERAIEYLDDQGPNGCPVQYHKTIVLATDGVGGCYKSGVGNAASSYTCPANDPFAGFKGHEQQLYGSLIPQLQSKNITVLVYHAGEAVKPHFISRTIPTSNAPSNYRASTSQSFLSLEELHALGYGGAQTPLSAIDPTSDVDGGFALWNCLAECPSCTSTTECRDAYALKNGGVPGNIFRRGSSGLADLATKTGGVFCPLLPLHPSGPGVYIDHDSDPDTPAVLPDNLRAPPGSRQEVAITNESIASQARRCMERMFKKNFILVEEE